MVRVPRPPAKTSSPPSVVRSDSLPPLHTRPEKAATPTTGYIHANALPLSQLNLIARGDSTQRAGTFYHFWATHCEPCMAELGDMVTLAKELNKKGAKVVFIAEENQYTREKAKKAFAAAWGESINWEEPKVLPEFNRQKGYEQKGYEISPGFFYAVTSTTGDIRTKLGIKSGALPLNVLVRGSPRTLNKNQVLFQYKGRMDSSGRQALKDALPPTPLQRRSTS